RARRITQSRLRRADICKAVPDIAGPVFAGDLGLDLDTQGGAKKPSCLLDDHRSPAPDVEGAANGAVGAQREPAGFRNISHMYKVTALLAVFEYQRRARVEQARGEDGENAAVGVRQRLMGPVDVKETQCDSRNLVGPPNH